MNNIGIWKTIYEEDFDRDMFLYHYTNVEKAFKILDGKTLKFGRINNMNDTLESKPKIPNMSNDDMLTISSLINLLKYTNNSFVQLLCMSLDDIIQVEAHSQRQYYGDYSGRGFALPRMWAQYADNNNGICLIFDKSKLSSIIKEQLNRKLIDHGRVSYLSHFEHVNFSFNNVIEDSKKYIKKYNLSRDNDILLFARAHQNFTRYNYFVKLDDWKGEKEYRFLAFDREDIYIKDIQSALVGIVVGEKISDTNLKIIKYLVDEKIEIMKISFNCDGCALLNTY